MEAMLGKENLSSFSDFMKKEVKNDITSSFLSSLEQIFTSSLLVFTQKHKILVREMSLKMKWLKVYTNLSPDYSTLLLNFDLF